MYANFPLVTITNSVQFNARCLAILSMQNQRHHPLPWKILHIFAYHSPLFSFYFRSADAGSINLMCGLAYPFSDLIVSSVGFSRMPIGFSPMPLFVPFRYSPKKKSFHSGLWLIFAAQNKRQIFEASIYSQVDFIIFSGHVCLLYIFAKDTICSRTTARAFFGCVSI